MKRLVFLVLTAAVTITLVGVFTLHRRDRRGDDTLLKAPLSNSTAVVYEHLCAQLESLVPAEEGAQSGMVQSTILRRSSSHFQWIPLALWFLVGLTFLGLLYLGIHRLRVVSMFVIVVSLFSLGVNAQVTVREPKEDAKGLSQEMAKKTSQIMAILDGIASSPPPSASAPASAPVPAAAPAPATAPAPSAAPTPKAAPATPLEPTRSPEPKEAAVFLQEFTGVSSFSPRTIWSLVDALERADLPGFQHQLQAAGLPASLDVVRLCLPADTPSETVLAGLQSVYDPEQPLVETLARFSAGDDALQNARERCPKDPYACLPEPAKGFLIQAGLVTLIRSMTPNCVPSDEMFGHLMNLEERVTRLEAGGVIK